MNAKTQAEIPNEGIVIVMDKVRNASLICKARFLKAMIDGRSSSLY